MLSKSGTLRDAFILPCANNINVPRDGSRPHLNGLGKPSIADAFIDGGRGKAGGLANSWKADKCLHDFLLSG